MTLEPAPHDVVVVGGGPAGASAACLLARAGRSVLLLEREPAPRHKVCGEFVSFEAEASLSDLGVDVRALGAARIARVRLVHGGETAEAALPFEGFGLTRKALDATLLAAASEAGVTVRRGEAVREVAAGEGTSLLLSGGRGLEPATVFLASGKHDVRGAKRARAEGPRDLIGFKMYFRLAASQDAALAGHSEMILFEGGYAGLQQVEGGIANLCLLVRRERFERLARSWEALLAHLVAECPHLARRLQAAVPLLDKPLAIFRIPYGFVHAPAADDPSNLFRLGDQAGVIPSFSGEGIAIALHTARLATAAYLAAGNDAARYHEALRRDIRGQIRLAAWLYGLAQNPVGRRALLMTCRAWPAAMRSAAVWTRVPARAQERTRRALGRIRSDHPAPSS